MAPASWFSQLESLPHVASKQPASMTQKKAALAAAKEQLEAEQRAFARKREKKADKDRRYMDQLEVSGTLDDRVAALTLRISESPLHALDALETLLSMAEKKDRRSQLIALEALKDVFVHNLLPDRRLVRFSQRPCNAERVTPRHLMLWHFESVLAKKYNQLIDVVERGTRDTVDSHKLSHINLAVELLSAKPEGEARLLEILVNKLGDPERKTTARVVKNLHLLLEEHSAMKSVVAYEVQQYLHRPGLSSRAVYMGICFLNQLKFHSGDSQLASKLTQTYFRIFEAHIQNNLDSVKKKGTPAKTRKNGDRAGDSKEDTGNRLLGALLTGVARAQPYCVKDEGKDFEYVQKHADTLFRMAHVAPAGTAVTALHLLFTLSCGDTINAKESNDEKVSADVTRLRNRFYRALYQRLQHGDFLLGKKSTLWLNLVFKALLADEVPARIAAFAKRLASMSLHVNASASAGIVFLLSEVAQVHDVVQVMLDSVASSRANQKEMKPHAEYIPRVREPLYAVRPPPNQQEEGTDGAEKIDVAVEFTDSLSPPPLFEFGMLYKHVHPSVTAFSESILLDGNHRVTYEGDPLKDFALGPFLNRFAFRNPKKRDIQRLRSVAGERTRPAVDLDFTNASEQLFLAKYREIQAERERTGLALRKKKKSVASTDGDLEGSDFIDAATNDLDSLFDREEDPEYEAFADHLAQDLMKSTGEDTYDDDDEDINFTQEMFSKSDPQHADEAAETDAVEDDSEEAAATGEENADEFDKELVHAFARMDGLEDDDGEDKEKSQTEMSQLQKARKRAAGSTFASVDNFEDLLNASEEQAIALWNSGKKRINAKVRTSKRKRRAS